VTVAKNRQETNKAALGGRPCCNNQIRIPDREVFAVLISLPVDPDDRGPRRAGFLAVGWW
jgi:hypothetical protein